MHYKDFEAQVASIIEEEGVPATDSDWSWLCWKAFGRLNVQLAAHQSPSNRIEEEPLIISDFKPEGPGC